MNKNEQKRAGAPRKTPDGGLRVTFYLPRQVADWVRSHGGAQWIRNRAFQEMSQSNTEEKNGTDQSV